MRHAEVTWADAGRADVTLDGVTLRVLVNRGDTLTVGAYACLLEQGRTVVCLGEIPVVTP